MGCGPSVCLHRGGASAAQRLEQPLGELCTDQVVSRALRIGVGC